MNLLSSNASDAKIECQIKDWMKSATKCDGGHKIRAEKKLCQSGITQSESVHDHLDKQTVVSHL